MLAETPSLSFRDGKKEAKEGFDNKDVHAELAKNVVIGKEQYLLPLGYFVSGERLAYNRTKPQNYIRI